MAKAPSLPGDQSLIEHTFTRGLVRDSNDIPAGGLYDVTDYLVEEPGVLYKRGGWARHSAALGGAASCLWVGAINTPTRVLAINSSFDLYDVTTAGTATLVGHVGFVPREHSTQYVDRIILVPPDASVLPQKAYWDVPSGTVKLAPLGTTPPAAGFSSVYAGRLVLARGPASVTPSVLGRVYFSELPDVEAAWDPLKNFDSSYEITGLAAISGTLLLFSSQHVERVIGGVPPAVEGFDMQLQPLVGVGCLDARSIVVWDYSVIFAGEEGVWTTTGAGVDSLTEKPDGTGIQVFWRRLFPRGQVRQIVAGLFNRDFYIVTVLDSTNTAIETLLCHLPSQAWTRLKNVTANGLVQGRTPQGVLELYAADPKAPYVNRVTDILLPTFNNMSDGDGTPVQPSFITRTLDGGMSTLKAYGYGRLSYNLKGTPGAASLKVTKVTGLGQEVTKDVATLTTVTASEQVNRERFRLFGDHQAIALQVTQHGPTAETNIYYAEVEMRTYAPGADFDA